MLGQQAVNKDRERARVFKSSPRDLILSFATSAFGGGATSAASRQKGHKQAQRLAT